MALPKVTINISNGNLVFPSPSTDGISGYITFNNNVADLTSFSVTNPVILFDRLSTVELTGITSTSTNFKREHYQISEYFRMNPNGKLYIGVFPVPVSTNDFDEVNTMMLYSDGDIKQIAVDNYSKVLSATEISTLQAKAEVLESEKTPIQILYAGDTSTLTLSTMPNFRVADIGRFVSVVIAQDFSGVGGTLATSTTKTVSTIGAILGAISSAKVSESIMWVQKFNYTNGVENSIPALYLTTGLVKIKNLSSAEKEALDEKGVMFLLKHPNTSGTYLNNDHLAVKLTDDYRFLYLSRPINKIERLSHSAVMPLLGSPLKLQKGGIMTPETIATYQKALGDVLNPMRLNGEISDFKVNINPLQDVLTTETIEIEIAVLPIGCAKYLIITIGYSTNL